MKRILIAILGVAALAACTKTEVVSISEGNTIKFDNAFVGNPTKAGLDEQYGPSKLPPHFFVYATNDDGDVFIGTKVYPNGDGIWVYDDLKPWQGSKNYKFAAYVVSDETGLTTGNGSVSFTSGNLKIEEYVSDDTHQRDLLMAKSNQDLNAKNEPVAFTFKHALAMIKFTLKNGLGNNELTITGFKVEGVNTKGNVEINGDNNISWTNPDVPGAFTNSMEITSTQAKAGVSDEFVVIPQSKEIKVSFTVTVKDRPEITKTLEATIPITNTNWISGNRYNYVATITGTDMDVIEFNPPVVEDWGNYNDPGTDFNF